MFDFALTQSGDLMFEQNNDKPRPLKISFNIGKAKPLRLHFETTECFPAERPSGGLGISFDIKSGNNDKRVVILNNDQAMAQLIEFRLTTALGQITDRSTIGSKLELVKHKPLYDIAIQALASTYAKEAILDIMPNAQVNVEPEVNYNNGYTQSLNVYIYDNGVLIFKYKIEE